MNTKIFISKPFDAGKAEEGTCDDEYSSEAYAEPHDSDEPGGLEAVGEGSTHGRARIGSANVYLYEPDVPLRTVNLTTSIRYPY